MRRYNEHPDGGNATAEFLSAAAVASMLETSEWRLRVWLENGRALGIRFDLLPLLPVAYEQLATDGDLEPRGSRGRERLLLTPDGVEPVEIDDPDEHARVDRHWEAAALALLTDDDSALRRFADLTVQGVVLASEREQLQAWGDATSKPSETL